MQLKINEERVFSLPMHTGYRSRHTKTTEAMCYNGMLITCKDDTAPSNT